MKPSALSTKAAPPISQPQPNVRHFLDLHLCSAEDLRDILDLALDLKEEHKRGQKLQTELSGKTLAMIFEKPSTRTRVSFQVAMNQLNGHAISLRPEETQLGRGETIADTARVLSRYVNAVMIRTHDEKRLQEFAQHSAIPVINGLTDQSHPCQIMADVMTFEEHRGHIKGKRIAWCGDGNNVARSWIHAAVQFQFDLVLCCPLDLLPPKDILDWAKSQGGNIIVEQNIDKAVAAADCVVTDTWVSMGQQDAAQRMEKLKPYQVNERVMALAKSHAIFMHCLPAHREEEVTAGVFDGAQSVVWDEAENRLHIQKAILCWCMA